MRLCKSDVLEAVAHKAEKYVDQEGFIDLVYASSVQHGYMDALTAYAHHVYSTDGSDYVDYQSEQKHLNQMRTKLVYTGANCRYNRGYKAGCLALKSILSRLKAEKEVSP